MSEKIARECQPHARIEDKWTKLTGNKHGLEPANEDDLHAAKLLHTQLATLAKRPSQLGAEDCAEETDAQGQADVFCFSQPGRAAAKCICFGVASDRDH